MANKALLFIGFLDCQRVLFFLAERIIKSSTSEPVTLCSEGLRSGHYLTYPCQQI